MRKSRKSSYIILKSFLNLEHFLQRTTTQGFQSLRDRSLLSVKTFKIQFFCRNYFFLHFKKMINSCLPKRYHNKPTHFCIENHLFETSKCNTFQKISKAEFFWMQYAKIRRNLKNSLINQLFFAYLQPLKLTL